MPAFTKTVIIDFLASKGYRTPPNGITEHYPVDWTLSSHTAAFLDLNADAVRKDDEVPDRPIRLMARREDYGYQRFGQWKLVSAAEISPGVKSKAYDRQHETPKNSPSWPDEKNPRNV